MVFKNYRINIIIRVILLAATIFLLFYTLQIQLFHCTCHCGSGCHFSDCLTDPVSWIKPTGN